MEYNLSGKVAVISGVAMGQGMACALAFAQQGVHIIGVDVFEGIDLPNNRINTAPEMMELVSACKKNGVDFYPIKADVRKFDDIQKGLQLIVKKLHSIDILFNNAGVCFYSSMDQMEESDWDRMMDINLKGAWNMCRAVYPYMKKQKSGVIINNSSVGGLRGMNRLSHYAASKWGLTGLTKSWAIEMAPFNIRVLSIHPTGVNTPMNNKLAEMEGKTPQEIASASAGNLMPVPWIEPEDVAESVVFLASDKAKFVTGSQYVLDAGLLTR